METNIGGGFISRALDRIAAPSANMSWTQLAAAAVFIVVVLAAWRQVTLFIMREV